MKPPLSIGTRIKTNKWMGCMGFRRPPQTAEPNRGRNNASVPSRRSWRRVPAQAKFAGARVVLAKGADAPGAVGQAPPGTELGPSDVAWNVKAMVAGNNVCDRLRRGRPTANLRCRVSLLCTVNRLQAKGVYPKQRASGFVYLWTSVGNPSRALRAKRKAFHPFKCLEMVVWRAGGPVCGGI